jgi:hypothetical protein
MNRPYSVGLIQHIIVCPQRATWRAHGRKVIGGERVEEEILRETQRGGYDLLVLGTGSRTGRSSVFLDRRTEQLLSQAPCTVIVVVPRSLRTDFLH